MNENLERVETKLLTEMLKNNNPITRCAVLCELVRRGTHSSSIKEAISKLKDDRNPFWNTYLVSDFAVAALHLLNWEEYHGTKEEINRLISSKLLFDGDRETGVGSLEKDDLTLCCTGENDMKRLHDYLDYQRITIINRNGETAKGAPINVIYSDESVSGEDEIDIVLDNGSIIGFCESDIRDIQISQDHH